MGKISQKFANVKAKQKVVFASRDAAMHTRFNGKTVLEVAGELDLDEEQLDIIEGQNGIFSLLIQDGGTDIIIPMSKGLLADFEQDGLDPEDIMASEFRVSDAPVWEKDAKGVLTKTDKKAPMLTVGKASGSFSYARQNVLAESEEVEG